MLLTEMRPRNFMRSGSIIALIFGWRSSTKPAGRQLYGGKFCGASGGCLGHGLGGPLGTLGGNVIAANPPYFSLVVLGPGLYVRRSPLVWKVVPLKFDPMLDGHEVPLQR